MKCILLAILTFIASISLTSCWKQRDVQKAVLDSVGKRIELAKVDGDSSEFTILRFVSHPSCTSCQLKLGVWKVYHKRLTRRFGDKIGLRFICETKNIKEANTLFDMYGYSNIATVDTVVNFYSSNGLNPDLGDDVVFLLDSCNTILSIGNPNDNIRVDSLFNEIISGNFKRN
jgi:hypothetical protein